jgi:hypothetical protein
LISIVTRPGVCPPADVPITVVKGSATITVSG